ncbi:MAG: JAB domain-containing protein [Lachnospiraceae bacterium]|nr:JAB domain-containing protein [Lachnospiraceae bacterium]
MRINFYEARLSEDKRIMLVKEKGVNYDVGKLNSPEDIVLMMRKLLHVEQMAEEHCYMIAMNSSCKVLGVFFISKGTVNVSLVTPRELYIRALLAGAVQIVLCHNHPSGNAIPSEQDIAITQKIKEAGEMININLADHIIIGSDSYLSFKEAKIL